MPDIELAYVTADEALVVPLEVGEGTTIEQAIEASGLLARCPEIDLKVNRVGSYGRLRKLDEVVGAGERIEIYRPLPEDPKEARRRRAKR